MTTKRTMDDAQFARIEQSILTLLDQRSAGATICPSEAARLLASNPDDQSWREWMPAVRAAAARMAKNGQIEVTQGGIPVDIAAARGPVRLLLVRGADT